MRTSFIFAMFCLAGGLVPSLAVRKEEDFFHWHRESLRLDLLARRLKALEESQSSPSWAQLPLHEQEKSEKTLHDVRYEIANLYKDDPHRQNLKFPT
ncbi:hypothetical protein F5148DRAFT_1210376 [Russula earlei]|uniref:Uncharacterized protein n=1 Tax=Russula earlei TaxID=71964 RepID=A0ACC0U6P3_9AGAM|nr:hypothetical protein F5148DRAFT_1210376 [Russula earlei]